MGNLEGREIFIYKNIMLIWLNEYYVLLWGVFNRSKEEKDFLDRV